MQLSYAAELNGSQLHWIDQPPAVGLHQRVRIFFDTLKPQAPPVNAKTLAREALDGLWGCLPKTTRSDTLNTLADMRGEWDRDHTRR
jgi:hypothetical protein